MFCQGNFGDAYAFKLTGSKDAGHSLTGDKLSAGGKFLPAINKRSQDKNSAKAMCEWIVRELKLAPEAPAEAPAAETPAPAPAAPAEAPAAAEIDTSLL